MNGTEIDGLFAEAKKQIPSIRDCRFLLSEKTISKFENRCKKLQELLEEIRKDFPEACYFVEGESGLHLMLAEPVDEGRLNMSRSACASDNLEITGGSI